MQALKATINLGVTARRPKVHDVQTLRFSGLGTCVGVTSNVNRELHSPGKHLGVQIQRREFL